MLSVCNFTILDSVCGRVASNCTAWTPVAVSNTGSDNGVYKKRIATEADSPVFCKVKVILK